MKKNLLKFAFLFSLSLFSITSFAQDVPGGSGDGSVTPPDGGGTSGSATQPLSVHFTRNNGDGTCGGMAQIRMYYTAAPTVAPVLTQIYYQGAPLYSNFTAVTGNLSTYASNGYVSYCLPTSNIPPAIKLTLTYNASTSQNDASISGTD